MVVVVLIIVILCNVFCFPTSSNSARLPQLSCVLNVLHGGTKQGKAYAATYVLLTRAQVLLTHVIVPYADLTLTNFSTSPQLGLGVFRRPVACTPKVVFTELQNLQLLLATSFETIQLLLRNCNFFVKLFSEASFNLFYH